MRRREKWEKALGTPCLREVGPEVPEGRHGGAWVARGPAVSRGVGGMPSRRTQRGHGRPAPPEMSGLRDGNRGALVEEGAALEYGEEQVMG